MVLFENFKREILFLYFEHSTYYQTIAVALTDVGFTCLMLIQALLRKAKQRAAAEHGIGPGQSQYDVDFFFSLFLSLI